MIKAGGPPVLVTICSTCSLLHFLDVGRTTRVEPRVVGSHVLAVRSHTQNARHLPINSHGGHARGIEIAFGQATAYAVTDRLDLILRIFFDPAW